VNYLNVTNGQNERLKAFLLGLPWESPSHKMQAVVRHGPRRSLRRPWNWGRERDIARCSGQNAVFCEESFGNNGALYVHLTYKDIDRFRKESVHELSVLIESQPGKQSSRSKRSPEITIEPIAV